MYYFRLCFFSLLFLTTIAYATTADLQKDSFQFSSQTQMKSAVSDISDNAFFDYQLVLNFILAFVIVFLIVFYRRYDMKKVHDEHEKKMEDELKKSDDKNKMIFHQSKLISMGEMIENIAHQWRQPLSQINSAVLVIDDMLYEKKVKDIVIEEKLLEIESLTKYMSKTIDDFKNFFNQEKKKEKFQLKELIEKSIYIVRGTLKSNNIEINVITDTKIIFYGYPNELQQVIVVILNNAKDMFILRNIFKPKIELRVEQADGYYQINICDNAGGIDPNIIDKIFEPYFTTKHKSQGTGLGLYISKMIIEESMGGELSVSKTKNGTCFHILLKETDE